MKNDLLASRLMATHGGHFLRAADAVDMLIMMGNKFLVDLGIHPIYY